MTARVESSPPERRASAFLFMVTPGAPWRVSAERTGHRAEIGGKRYQMKAEKVNS